MFRTISELFGTADKAPAAIVSLVGRKEYEQCAKDLYFFLQVTVLQVYDHCGSSSVFSSFTI